MYKLKGSSVIIENQSLPIYDKVDVLVCGGGMAGIAASITAARRGAKTLLVERAGFLGGTATGALMGLIVIPFKELTGFPLEFFSFLAELGGAAKGEVVPWDIEAFKYASQEMVLNAGVNILFYTICSEPLVKNGCFDGIIIENKSGRQAVLAKVIIDATGDGDIAARGGVPFVKGREKDGAMRPATVMGLLSNVNLYQLKEWIALHPEDVAQDPRRNILDINSGIIRIDGFFSILERAKQVGLIDKAMPVNYLRFNGKFLPQQASHASIVLNSTRVYNIDGTNGIDITKAEIEGRRQLWEVVRICQKMVPGFEYSTLVNTSTYIGVRETRRIKGRRILTYNDIANKRKFPDTVAVMTSLNYGDAEIHSPDYGHEGSINDIWAREMVLDLIKFEFPIDCLLPPREYKNLIVAGRCASVTHDADRFTRNMAPVALMGQAAGELAAIMAQEEEPDWDKIPIKELQSRLIAAGVIS